MISSPFRLATSQYVKKSKTSQEKCLTLESREYWGLKWSDTASPHLKAMPPLHRLTLAVRRRCRGDRNTRISFRPFVWQDN